MAEAEFGELEERDGAIVGLRLIGGLGMAEIAAAHGISVSRVAYVVGRFKRVRRREARAERLRRGEW